MNLHRFGLWAGGFGLWALGFALRSPKLTAQSATAQQPRTASHPDSQTIVFVCEHGTVKSVVAMAQFQQLARERRLPYRAVSRGTAPDSAVPAFVRAGLQRDGMALSSFVPTRFGERDLLEAVQVISFDQPIVARIVGSRVPLMAWDNLPSVTANYAVARDSIRSRVAALVESLERTQRRAPHR